MEAKRAGPRRSARKLGALLRLSVSREAIRHVLFRHGLARLGLPPVKPVQRFAAAAPNELWQIAIMGKVHFPLIGTSTSAARAYRKASCANNVG